MIENFFLDLDENWRLKTDRPIPLKIVGSMALMFQCDYRRRTKDSDVYEVADITQQIKDELIGLAGKESLLFKKHRIFIDIIKPVVLFLPPIPIFHSLNNSKLEKMQNFKIEMLDAVDVAVSKLYRFVQQDIDDIHAAIDSGKITHQKLIERLVLAKERWLLDARASYLPTVLKNLNTIERDIFVTKETQIELPDYIFN